MSACINYLPNVEIMDCNYIHINKWNFPRPVYYPYWRFYWNNKPGAYLNHSKKRIEMKPDLLFLIPPHTQLSASSVDPFHHLYIHLNIGSPYDRIIPRVYTFFLDEVLQELLKKICSELTAPQPGELQKSLLLYTLIYYSLHQFGKNDFMDEESVDERIEKTMKILDHNISRLYTNEELADIANMSVNSFVRLFSRETGISPQKYSRQQRIDKAGLLLHFTNKTIDEISQETGFINRYHFSRVFKSLTGQAPVEFRINRTASEIK